MRGTDRRFTHPVWPASLPVTGTEADPVTHTEANPVTDTEADSVTDQDARPAK